MPRRAQQTRDTSERGARARTTQRVTTTRSSVGVAGSRSRAMRHGARGAVSGSKSRWRRSIDRRRVLASKPSQIAGSAASRRRILLQPRNVCARSSRHASRAGHGPEILWNAAGRSERTGWFIDGGETKAAAVSTASGRAAYILWGLTPFLRTTHGGQAPLLEPLVTADPLLQRMHVSVVVKASKTQGVNGSAHPSWSGTVGDRRLPTFTTSRGREEIGA